MTIYNITFIIMTRIKSKKFFSMHNIEITSDVIRKYKSWWTLEEIRVWKEFIIENFQAEVKAFKKNNNF